MKKQNQGQAETGRNQKTIIPKVRYHPSIQIHILGDGPQVQPRVSPPAKPLPQTGANRKMVQQNQDTDEVIRGSAVRPRPVGGKKQKQTTPKPVPRAARDPHPAPTSSLGSDKTPNGPEQVPLGSEDQLDQRTVKEVEVLTRGQRTNPKWFAWRKNRITASVAHSIARCRFVNGKSQTPPISYLAAVTGERRRVQTRAMSWGIKMEAEAVRKYQELKSASLGRPVSVQECGLFIDAQRPWLAASPDGIVTDRKTGQRLLCLEVKCPHKHKDRRVEDACREDRAFCLKILDQDGQTPGQVPAYSLKTSHSYYTQIQCQLAVTGLRCADLVVYTKLETAIVPVTFDPDMWGETVSKLQRFYTGAVLPHLRSRTRQEGGAAWAPEL